MRQLGVATLLALGLLGCGGKSSNSGGDGGGANTAGTSAGGASTQPRSCEVDGKTYASGTSFKASDGCNSCSCDDGEVSCTEIGCVDQCPGLSSSYQSVLERGKSCDPQAANECTLLVASGLRCGCQTFVNPNLFSRDAAAAVEKEFAANACAEGVACGPCPSPPTQGYCAPNGQCADLHDSGERACKVGGVIYPSGSTGVQDPFSCNQCVCQDGELACDDEACAKPCPENTKPGRGCAECGPTDKCLVPEYDCMPVCVDTCAQGACINGSCVGYCG